MTILHYNYAIQTN